MMKRIVLCIALCAAMLTPATAQGFLTKLKEKIVEKVVKSEPAAQQPAQVADSQPEAAKVGGRQVDVKITGTLMEPVTMTLPTGQTQTITQLPHKFKVPKGALPMQVTFTSPSYLYAPIVVNRKEADKDVGRTYVLKKQQKPLMQQQVVMQQTATAVQPAPAMAPTAAQATASAVDWSRGVNQVPVGSRRSDNTFALIIANEHYELASDVAMAQNDGEVFKAYCEKTLGLAAFQVKYYPDATYGKMSRAFREMKDIATAFNGQVNLIVYYAGHGIPDNASKDAFLMPVDADGTDTGVCYSLKRLYKEIDDLHVNQCVVFMDACFSGAKRDGDMIVAARGVAIKPREEKPQSSTVVFSATSDEEAAYSYKDEQHGLFTYCLLKKLQESRGNVTLGELADYLARNVSQKSVVINGKKQTPTVIASDDLLQTWKQKTLTR